MRLGARAGNRGLSHTLGHLVLLVLPALLVISAGCGRQSQEAAAEIIAFEPPQGQVSPGDPAEALVRFENTGPETHTFFVGYSVRDAAGEWLDAPAVPVELEPGAESGETALVTPPLETPGYYAARVSVWSEEPGGEGDTGAERLAEQAEESAFQVAGVPEDFTQTGALPAGWKATERKLGRGRILPDNVSMEDGKYGSRCPRTP